MLQQVRDARLRRRSAADHPHTLNTLDDLGVTYPDVGTKQLDDPVIRHFATSNGRSSGPNTRALSRPRTTGLAMRTQANCLGQPVVRALSDGKHSSVSASTPTRNGRWPTSPWSPDYWAAERGGRLESRFLTPRRSSYRTTPAVCRRLTAWRLRIQAEGTVPEAIALLEQVRDGQVKKIGVEHVETLATLLSLVRGLSQGTGRLAEEAIALVTSRCMTCPG